MFWKSGDYRFFTSGGNTKEIAVTVTPSFEIAGPWNVTFVPATGAKTIEKTMDKLALWNEDADPEIKYFRERQAIKKPLH